MSEDPNSMTNSHPNDFALFELGTFNTETARFEIYAQPLSLGLANQFSVAEEPVRAVADSLRTVTPGGQN